MTDDIRAISRTSPQSVLQIDSSGTTVMYVPLQSMWIILILNRDSCQKMMVVCLMVLPYPVVLETCSVRRQHINSWQGSVPVMRSKQNLQAFLASIMVATSKVPALDVFWSLWSEDFAKRGAFGNSIGQIGPRVLKYFYTPGPIVTFK